MQEFIVPLRVDNIPFDSFPAELLRLNGIDFFNDWGTGLDKLTNYLEKCNTPKNIVNSINIGNAITRWKELKALKTSIPLEKVDNYYSNLFPINLPKNLFIYSTVEIEQILKENHFPYLKKGNMIITLVCPDCITKCYNKTVEVKSFNFQELINFDKSIIAFDTEIKSPNKLCINLLNWNIDNFFYKKGLLKYSIHEEKRSKNRYYFKSNIKSKRSLESREKILSGSYYDKHWHYAISAYYTKSPYDGIIFKAHLIFTNANNYPISDPLQISARRSKGRRFYNKDWRDLLQTAIYYLSDGSDNLVNNLCCENNQLIIDSKPYIFSSVIGYIEPIKTQDETIEDIFDDE